MLMDDGYTNNERSAAAELEMPVEELRRILEVYTAHCRADAQRLREVSRRRMEAHGFPPLD